MKQEVDARKERIDADAAWELLSDAREIITARGKKSQRWDPAKDDREAILKQAMGPSGNLRAPALRIGKRWLIGFEADTYTSELD